MTTTSFSVGSFVQLNRGVLQSVIWEIASLHPERSESPRMAGVEVYYNPEKLRLRDDHIVEILGGKFLHLKHLDHASPLLVLAVAGLEAGA